jgi:lytic murein transglycosylase
MTVSARLASLALSGSLLLAVAGAASAATCRDPAGFDKYLADLEQEAVAQGVSRQTVSSATAGLSFDQGILNRDRGQKVFRQSFEEFSGRMVSSYRLKRGAQLLRQNAGLFQRIEDQFGVPGAVLVALWGLETDFGATHGNFPVLRATATLGFDCRRADMFQDEFIAALKIVDRGDMVPDQMRGAWAGEMGQTQFMPSSWIKFGVDYDGDGRRDLIHSAPDALASTANYLKSYGWQRGQPWGEGTANFAVLQQWNKSVVYSKTVAFYAQRLSPQSTAGE